MSCDWFADRQHRGHKKQGLSQGYDDSYVFTNAKEKRKSDDKKYENDAIIKMISVEFMTKL